MQTPLVQLDHVTMRFKIPHESSHTLKEWAIGWLRSRNRSTDFTAVEDASLQVNASECVGIIGRNGSGKSTLLKIIAGVFSPTSGSRLVRGSIAPLIELGAGFNGELTGRENVFLSGAIMGRSKSEMLARYDSIVEFAELHDFMDVPVKNYSSGMYARLGFSIATDVSADLLILDEILAVGDEAFQLKCMGRVRDHLSRGGTVLFVSHSADSVRKICTRAIVMSHGHIEFDGAVDAAIDHYHGHSLGAA